MFIYVMDVESKKKLCEMGFELLKDNGKKEGAVWVFLNKKNFQFEQLEISCVVSDTLTF